MGGAEQNNALVKEDEYTLKTDMLTARGERWVRRHSSELASISPNRGEVVLFPGKCNNHVNELRIQTCKMFQAGLLILSKVTIIRGKKTPGRHTKMSLPHR